jgi:hypothetical protein
MVSDNGVGFPEDLDFIPVVYLTALGNENTLQRAKVTEHYGYISSTSRALALFQCAELCAGRSLDHRGGPVAAVVTPHVVLLMWHGGARSTTPSHQRSNQEGE